ncbi:MAG: DUF1559 domain-containing protein [Planctomycetes bacterium]|nr:DUF1559 domain-containing protein [Planctomycetota bacterium]MBL7042951.1 DUF1559 domain-containing protein [Pirellulaceae bacterium]
MKNRQNGFTLVELLVVIAIIGILVALLLPAIQAAREAARRTQCSQNLSQLIIAVHNYEMAWSVYPPGTIEKKGPIQNHAHGYHHNWLIQLLPYMEQKNAYQHIDRTVGVYHKNNVPVRQLTIDNLLCPSQPATPQGYSSYAGCHHDLEAPIDVNNNGVFFLNSRITYDDITDGSAYTLFVGEKLIEQGDLGWMSGTSATLRNTGVPPNASVAGGGKPNWARGPAGEQELWDGSDGMYGAEYGESGEMGGAEADAEVVVEEREEVEPTGPPPKGPVLPVGGFGSVHPGGCQFAFGDGRVSYLSESMSLQVYQQLGHRADGKLLDSF